MTTFLRIGALMALTICAAPRICAAADVVRLDNGLTVLIQEDHRFPLVAARLYAAAGSGYETPEQAGISHQLEHMLFKGTEKRGPGDVAREVESVGGYLNAYTSFDSTTYVVDVPGEELALALDILKDMAFNAAIDPEELEREKTVVLSELERGEDTPGSRLFKDLQSLLFSGTSYEWPIIGYRETVKSFTSEDIRAYIEDRYQPDSMLLVIVGDVTKEEALEQARAQFGDLKNTREVTRGAPHPMPQAAPAPRLVVETGPWNKVYMMAGFPTPGSHSPDAAPLKVLGRILGGDKSSRLYRRFKYEDGLVDDIAAGAWSLERAGMLYIYATLDAANVEKFWKELTEELNALPETAFSQDEIDRAVLNLSDSLYRSKETLSGLASKLGEIQFFHGDLGAEVRYLRELEATDAATLKDLLATYVVPGRMAGAMLLPEGAEVMATTAGAENAPRIAEALVQAAAKRWSAPAPSAQELAARLTHKEDTGATDLPVEEVGRRGEPEIVPLAPGRTLVLLPDSTLPYTSLDMTFQGGDRLVDETTQGLAELTARTLPKSTATRSATEIQEFLENRAATILATSGRDTFSLRADFPQRFTDDVLGLFAEMHDGAAFDPAEAEREKRNQIAAITSREDQPLGLAFRNLFPFLYAQGPYGYLHQGAVEQIPNYTAEQLADFWNKQRTRPWTMAVCGDFNPAVIRAFAKKLANSAPAPASGFFPAPMTRDKKLDLHLPGRGQAHLILAYPVPGAEHPDSPTLSLMHAIMTGMGGPLFGELRNKQSLGYTVSAFLWQAPRTGFLAFYIGTSPDKIDVAEEGFRELIARFQAEPFTQADIERGQNALAGDYYRGHQSLGSRSREAAVLTTQGLPLDKNIRTIETTKTLTPNDVQDAAKRYLNREPYRLRVLP